MILHDLISFWMGPLATIPRVTTAAWEEQGHPSDLFSYLLLLGEQNIGFFLYIVFIELYFT